MAAANTTMTITVRARWWLVPGVLLWARVVGREPPAWLLKLWARYGIYVVRP